MKQSAKDKAKGTYHELKGNGETEGWESHEQSSLASRGSRRKARRQIPKGNRQSRKSTRKTLKTGVVCTI